MSPGASCRCGQFTCTDRCRFTMVKSDSLCGGQKTYTLPIGVGKRLRGGALQFRGRARFCPEDIPGMGVQIQ
jgi:hypothetical protein